MSSDSPGKSPLLYVVPIVVIIAGIVIYKMMPAPAPDNADPDPDSDGKTNVVAKDEKRTAEESRQLIELKDHAVALLENEKSGDAAEIFETLLQKVADEKIGYRNLAVARLLEIEQVDRLRKPQEFTQAIATAETAISQLQDKFSDDAITPLLRAKLSLVKARDPAEKERQTALAVSQLTAATEMSPDDPAIWYELYLIGQYSRDPSIKSTSQQALKRAYDLWPSNLFVLTDQLAVQTENQDVAVLETLANAKSLLEPFAESIQQRLKYNVLEFIDDAIAAVKKTDWRTAKSKALLTSRLVRPESIAQIDRRRVNRHLLEYILHDFGEEFYRAGIVPQPTSAAPIEVKFATAMTLGPSPEFSGIRQLKVVDYNLDGLWDLILVRPENIQIVLRKPASSELSTDSWEAPLIVNWEHPFEGVVAADLDRDYMENRVERDPKSATDLKTTTALHDTDIDFVGYGPDGLIVLQNEFDKAEQKRSLTPIEQSAEIQAIRGVIAAAVVDFDHDGDLDLVASTESGVVLLANMGNMQFKDISRYSSLPANNASPTVMIPVDWDRDMSVEVILAGPTMAKPGYLDNLLHGQFRWREFDDGFENLSNSTASVIAEVDGNVSWDLVSGNADGISVTRTTSPSSGIVNPTATNVVSDSAVKGIRSWDYDNDGFVDFLVWNESGIQIFRNTGHGEFQPASDLLESPPAEIEACEIADIDADGDLDVIVVTANQIQFVTNEGGNQNHWVDIVARAEGDANSKPSERTNMYGVGSLIELKVAGTYQSRVIDGAVTHFGLGQTQKADILRLVWTNGAPFNLMGPRTKTTVWEQQHLSSSCPYLYTWNGERFVFVTDLLWAGPLGLQLAEGVFAPSREWEYLKVPGEKMAEKDGEYVLQITEELWEAAYFDQVKLLAIDHPADVEVFSNEKVGPAEIAEFKIHTVRNARVPVSARDQRGRDVLPVIAARDNKYLKGYDNKLMQGLTEEHFIELDLGKLEDPKQIMLFLTGWIYPTDTSINIGISQNPDIDPPQPPSLWVLDQGGRWRNVMPYMGFPGGKTKTIAVDLSNVFLTDDYRVRIATSMEIYWDAAFFTVDEAPAELHQSELPLLAADLHYRGFSRRIEHPGNGPEDYDYNSKFPHPKWSPMGGRFTRFGNVTELVADSDDRLVIMGSGDEMTLRFKADAIALPDGWKRDFILYNVGWDKDANMNTLYGQSVEPLPFRGMNGYPDADGRQFPDTEFHREYLRKYQTRTQSYSRFWRNIREFKK